MEIYDGIGGEEAVRRIVQNFYQKVIKHPLLAPLFPVDIMPVVEKQEKFLTQFFGGPALYTSEYGHPKMRARHLPFPITQDRAGAWLECMQLALEEELQDKEWMAPIMARLTHTAHFFVNSEQ